MKKLTPMQFFAMLICTRAFSMMTFLPESTANALELMLGTVLSTVFQIVMICGMAAFHKRFPNDDMHPCGEPFKVGRQGSLYIVSCIFSYSVILCYRHLHLFYGLLFF